MPYVLILVLASAIGHFGALSQFQYANQAACESAGRAAHATESYIEWVCVPVSH